MSLTVCVLTLFATQTFAGNQPTGTTNSRTAQTQLTCAVTKLLLGEVVIGQTSDQLMTITNSGRTALVVLSAISTGPGFATNGLNLPLTLAAGESFTFRVTFTPQRSGPANGSISFVSDAPQQTLTIPLAGTGRTAGHLQVTPDAIDFGNESVESTGTQTGQLTASGGTVTISSATISGEEFQLGGLSLPLTIPPGQSVPFTVRFVPHGSESSSAVLSFASDAENAADEHASTVRMLPPVKHEVQLSWKASTSKHIVGYNIYRGAQSGGPYRKINGALDPNTKFTDPKVAAGDKYYYVATAVNSSKQESVYSKQIQVVIP